MSFQNQALKEERSYQNKQRSQVGLGKLRLSRANILSRNVSRAIRTVCLKSTGEKLPYLEF